MTIVSSGWITDQLYVVANDLKEFVSLVDDNPTRVMTFHLFIA